MQQQARLLNQLTPIDRHDSGNQAWGNCDCAGDKHLDLNTRVDMGMRNPAACPTAHHVNWSRK